MNALNQFITLGDRTHNLDRYTIDVTIVTVPEFSGWFDEMVEYNKGVAFTFVKDGNVVGYVEYL